MVFLSRFLRIFLFALCLAPAWSQVITTIAGTDWLFPGDGTRAVNAPIGGSFGLDVAVGPDGSFYIADQDSEMVMRVGTDGIIHVIAGNGFSGHWGDGGLAVNAGIFNPQSVAVDSAGNVYIAENGGAGNGGTIRMVMPDGIIKTICGTGALGSTGDGGPATQAGLNRPEGIAVDAAGTIYFAELGSGRIRKFTPGGIITTIGGGGQISGSKGDGGKATDAAFGTLLRLTVDSVGNVYFIDGFSTIRKITPQGIISTVAGGGQSSGDNIPATLAGIAPSAVAADAAGTLYLTDYFSGAIRSVKNGVIASIIGSGRGFGGDNGPGSQASFNFPLGGIALDASGNIFVADNENLRVREISGGTVRTVAGNGLFRLAGNGGPALSATLYYPQGIRTDANGNTYVVEATANRIRKIAPDGTISIFAGQGPFGFSGDNGPATDARLGVPSFLAIDPAGNVYVSDTINDVIRKIDTNQIITTIAGTQFSGYSGDGGPAAKAKFFEPRGLDFDGAGNLWIADSLNHAIRMIDTKGIVSTIAGNGSPGFSGDGGPAAMAQLNTPEGLRVRNPGTAQEAIYFSDAGNNRVRRIQPVNGQFMIDTVIGNGKTAYAGDGGPAAQASLNFPLGLAFDAYGYIYVADSNHEVIRSVSPDGVMHTAVGNGTFGFSGDGGSVNLAQLNGPFDITFNAAGNFLISDLYNGRIREVLLQPPSPQISPTSLAFTAPAGSSAVHQTISITSTIPNFYYGSIVPTGIDWLKSSPIVAYAPGGVEVTADPSGLQPGVYQSKVTVLALFFNPLTTDIPVTFTVTPAGAPSVAASPTSLRFQYVAGAAASSQGLTISNVGGGSLALNVTAATNTGSWLSASAATVNVGAFGSTRIQIQADPGSLAPGTYSGTITIASTNPPQSTVVPVTMIVTAVSQTILIPQTGLTFFAVQSGGLPPPQTFNILNSGQGQMAWNTSVSTVTGGNWLAAFPNGGVSDASSPSVPPAIRVNVFPGTLGPGIYFGSVKVTADGANNSPQVVSVVLNVLPPGSKVGPLAQPAGMIFVAAAGGESPGSQAVTVQSLNTATLTFSSGTSTSAGGSWLTALPPSGTVTAGAPATIQVQPLVDGLAAGVYRGTLTLSFSDGNSRTVNVVFIVTALGVGSGSAGRSAARDAAACPNQLSVVFTQLSAGSSVSVGFPGQVNVKVADDCGSPLVSGSVTASFSNGDAPVPLTALNDGTWAGTWTPQNSAAQAVVTATATDAARKLTGTAQVAVGFQQFTLPPVAAGVVNAASYALQAPIAPGTLISVFGSQLSDSSAGANSLPLPVNLGGSSMFIAGAQAPLLYASNGQVNAQVPYGIQVNAGQQYVISRGNTLSVAQGLTIAAASPGVFTADGSGKGQGDIFVAHADFSQVLADAAHPAAAGDVLVIYCTGLGEVNPALTAGMPAPLDHLSSAVNPVTVTIGGVTAAVQFAGLTPGFAGLYQVNAIVPKGVTPGSAVVVRLSGAGQVSAPVTMGVK